MGVGIPGFAGSQGIVVTLPVVAAAAQKSAPDAHFFEVPVASLLPGDSPRLNGVDKDHVARLAELDTALPPILVERGSMKVIDGMHRLLAARIRGHQSIKVEFFHGTESEAFLRAVQANVTHGFPLSHADRKAAAERIIATHPMMSDRAIAQVVGLGARSVATIRGCSTDAAQQSNTRLGKDGRVRPLSGVEGRLRVADLLAERPQASLREIARAAGVSVGTVSDVRKRIERGEAPVPSSSDRRGGVGRSEETAGYPLHTGRDVLNPLTLLNKLLRDPSLRLNEGGRQLLRLLRRNAVDAKELTDLITSVPPHCGDAVAALAGEYARMWVEFAAELDARAKSPSTVEAPNAQAPAPQPVRKRRFGGTG